MRLSLDKEADALFLYLREREPGMVARTKKVGRGINLLLDESDEVVGIEVLYLSHRAGRPLLEHLDLDFAPPYEPVEIEADIEIPKAVKHR